MDSIRPLAHPPHHRCESDFVYRENMYVEIGLHWEHTVDSAMKNIDSLHSE